MIISRRKLLASMAVLPGVMLYGNASAMENPENRFVFIILRGAMDGLTAVPPLGDSSYQSLRGALAVGKDQTLRLDADFGLHQNLSGLHQLYTDEQMIAFQAISSPYRERSHFDGQDVLENGGTKPLQMNDGWLSRALGSMPGANGLAVGQSVPLVLRGGGDVTSWVPSTPSDPEDETIERLLQLYQEDPVLQEALEKSIETDQMIGGAALGNVNNSAVAAKAIGSLMSAPEGPRIAVMEIGGWDTHNRQGVIKGRLPNKLSELDRAITALKKALGEVWQTSAVLVATEFGRTAKPNGSLGTDHGTGGAGFLLGGAVAGGRVVSNWPGLGASQLYQARDLKPTMSWHSVFKAVLSDHLGVSKAALDAGIFPQSSTVMASKGLIM